MSDSPNETRHQEPEAPPIGDPSVEPASEPVSPGALGDTVGTGSVIAIGCIGATLFLIVLGLVYILVTQVFG